MASAYFHFDKSEAFEKFKNVKCAWNEVNTRTHAQIIRHWSVIGVECFVGHRCARHTTLAKKPCQFVPNNVQMYDRTTKGEYEVKQCINFCIFAALILFNYPSGQHSLNFRS